MFIEFGRCPSYALRPAFKAATEIMPIGISSNNYGYSSGNANLQLLKKLEFATVLEIMICTHFGNVSNLTKLENPRAFAGYGMHNRSNPMTLEDRHDF